MSMTPERWQQIKVVLEDALELKPQQRSGFLAKACADDPALRQEAELFLALDDGEGLTGVLESLAGRVALPPGTRLGDYEVQSLLGMGGMGEVYRARDPRLRRDVAIKVLPSLVSNDPDRFRRFEQEARAAAALNHPHICTVHDIGDYHGQPFFVMELLEGQSLNERIAGKPIPISELVDFAVQTCDALQAAHSKGIIHRDIKPANVFLSTNGQIKILDFGLAKLVEERRSAISAATVPEAEISAGSLRGTAWGLMGTPAYLSPEQARGEEVDARTDIFSFGLVMYEMATGQRAFTGQISEDLINAILHETPGKPSGVVFESILNWVPVPPVRLNPDLPTELEGIINKCLEKDRNLRYQHASDIRTDLQRIQRETESSRLRPPRRVVVWAATALVVVLAIAVAAVVWLRGPSKPADQSEWVRITNLPDAVSQPSLSPDGRMLTFIRGHDTFAGPGQIYVKMLPEGEPVQLTRDNLPKMSPVFSPDGSKIAYTTAAGLHWDTWLVPILGGQPELWLPNASGLTWSKKGKILFSEIKDNNIHMALVSAEESRAGERDIYVPAGSCGMAHRTYPSPDSKWALVVEHAPGAVWLPCRLVRTDGSSAGRQVGAPSAGCTAAAWSPDGKWMYLNSSAGGTFHIWRQRFPDGKPEQITSGPTEQEGIAMAPDGRSFITAVGLRQSSVWIHDSSGERQVSMEGYSYDPKFTPDGKKLCYRILKGVSRISDASELRVVELASGRNEALLPGFLVGAGPYDISPDSQEAVVSALDHDGKRRLWMAPLDRRSAPRQVADLEGWAPMFGPGGEIFFQMTEGGSSHLYHIREDGSGLQRVIKQPNGVPMGFSRDGQWLAAFGEGFSVTAFPLRSGSPVPILRSHVASSDPNLRWSPDGRLLVISLPEAALLTAGRTYAIPLLPGWAFPEIPRGGFQSEAEIAKLAGERRIDAYDVAFGHSPEVYAFARESVQRNLYRIPLP